LSAEFPSLAEVHRKHPLIEYMPSDDPWATRYRCDCGWTSPEEDRCAECEGNGANCAAHGGGLARAIGKEFVTRTDHPKHVELMWMEARTIRNIEQLDALPPGAIVLTASPRLIPSSCIWIRDTSDADGHWWNYRGDDSFTSADVLYEKPEIALLLHHPDWPVPQ